MVDWTEAESQSQYTKSASGDAEQPLWAEEWEDETEETEFSIQLKYRHPLMLLSTPILDSHIKGSWLTM
jgi:hypothetical protein